MKKITLFLISLIMFGVSAVLAQTTDAPMITDKPIMAKVANVSISDETYKIDSNNIEKEISLQGENVLLSGSNNKITIKGIVGKISITGKDNDVYIETVNHITVSGNGNFVSWEKSTNANGKPVIVDKGGYNNIDKRSSNAVER